jgi:hypothetical protein
MSNLSSLLGSNDFNQLSQAQSMDPTANSSLSKFLPFLFNGGFPNPSMNSLGLGNQGSNDPLMNLFKSNNGGGLSFPSMGPKSLHSQNPSSLLFPGFGNSQNS